MGVHCSKIPPCRCSSIGHFLVLSREMSSRHSHFPMSFVKPPALKFVGRDSRGVDRLFHFPSISLTCRALGSILLRDLSLEGPSITANMPTYPYEILRCCIFHPYPEWCLGWRMQVWMCLERSLPELRFKMASKSHFKMFIANGIKRI